MKREYVYILGASHSGTTLLAMLLNAHPEIVSVGELARGGVADISGYRCSCRLPVVDCPFWKRVARGAADRGSTFRLTDFGTGFQLDRPWYVRRALMSEHRGRLLEAIRDLALRTSSTWRRHFDSRCRNYIAVVDSILSAAGARVLVDSSKLAHILKHVLRIPSLDTRVIHLVRDGRAVALTYMDQEEYADAGEPEMRRGGRGRPAGQDRPKLSMRRAADEWCRCLRSAEHVLAGVESNRYQRVHYDDLCRDTQGSLATVFRFMGVDPGLWAQDFRAAEHHVVGNGMRLDTSSEVVLDERWRSVLSKDQLRAFHSVARAINRRYGYAD